MAFSFGKTREALRFYRKFAPKTGAKGKENEKMAFTCKSLKSTGIEAHTETISGLKDSLDRAQVAQNVPAVPKERDEAREPPNIPEKGQCGRLQFRR